MSTDTSQSANLWADVAVPAWLWGGDPEGYFRAGRMELRRRDGTAKVRTHESYTQGRPALIRSEVLYRTGSLNQLGMLARQAEASLPTLPAMNGVLAGLEENVSVAQSSDVTPCLNRLVLRLTLTEAIDLPEAAAEVLHEIEALNASSESGSPHLFERVALVQVSVDPALKLRMRLPSVLLRIEQDPRLKSGDSGELAKAQSQGNLVFASGSGFIEGATLLGPYITPMLGSCSPFVWAVAAGRMTGPVVACLGRGIVGTKPLATSPLEMLSAVGPTTRRRLAPQVLEDQLAAVDWWVAALNSLFGALGDPVNFVGADGAYQPVRHLSVMGTVDQLFRRVGAMLVLDRNTDARQALLFTCLDTLESLNRVSPLKMFSLSHAEKTLKELEEQMPAGSRVILLPTARRGVEALKEVQEGFFIARQAGMASIPTPSGEAPLADAASRLLYAFRNATHGFGGKPGQQEEFASLISHHSGESPDDLPGLALLYLLDLLSHPERLVKIWRHSRGKPAGPASV